MTNYIGTVPATAFETAVKDRFTGLTTNYVDLTYSISNLAEIILWWNGVKQDYTNLTMTTSTRITLGGTLVAGDIVEVAYISRTKQSVAPSSASITLDMLSASGTKNSTTFLRGDNTFAAAGLSGWTSNSGNLLPDDAAKGIYLGVNSATAANLLSDYEEGVFTPNMAPTSGSFTTVGTNLGYYTKIGNNVHIQMELILTTKGSGSGNIDVTNLPFTSAATGLIHTNMLSRETQTMGAVYNVIMSRDVTALVILAPHMANGAQYSVNGWYRV